MENEFTVFTLHGKSIRVIKYLNGCPRWLAKDICLYFGDTDRCVSRLDKDVKMLVTVKDSLGRIRKATLVNEVGVYQLMFDCRPEKNRGKGGKESDIDLKKRIEKIVEFRRWIADTVLPTILTRSQILRGYADELERRERAEKGLLPSEKQFVFAVPDAFAEEFGSPADEGERCWKVVRPSAKANLKKGAPALRH